jgi:hypothetical protein
LQGEGEKAAVRGNGEMKGRRWCLFGTRDGSAAYTPPLAALKELIALVGREGEPSLMGSAQFLKNSPALFLVMLDLATSAIVKLGTIRK